MKTGFKQYCKFDHKIVILGFGSIAPALAPLLLRHLDIRPDQILVICDKPANIQIAQELGIQFLLHTVAADNYQSFLSQHIQEHDVVLNLSVGISCADMINFCQSKNALYLDTAIELWPTKLPNDGNETRRKTNYENREALLSATPKSGATAIINHGANPGLISHFVKQALCNIAADLHVDTGPLVSQADWARLSMKLGIKVIQTAEFDSQIMVKDKDKDEFVNTWSVRGLITEGSQPAETGWGSHERHWPEDACKHTHGCGSAIYLKTPGALTKVRTWTPLAGAFEGYMISHAEAISLTRFLTVHDKDGHVVYRPTVHYAYSPCPQALLSLDELVKNKWQPQSKQRLEIKHISTGMDEMGALLLGHAKNAYWFGSQLDIKTAQSLAPYNNATSLQVASSLLAAVIWAIKNPREGVIEAERVDHREVLSIAEPYLGTLKGYYSDWNPLKTHSGQTGKDSDPWQFANLRVSKE